jgi:hypothetical protein
MPLFLRNQFYGNMNPWQIKMYGSNTVSLFDSAAVGLMFGMGAIQYL